MAKRILIVDDDDQQRGDVQAVARRAGFAERDIVAVKNEADAHRLIVEDSFDVAVIDVSLTKENCEGLELIKLLRLQQSLCWIAGLTSHRYDLGDEVLNQGGNDFVYTEWATIDWKDLLLDRLTRWRKARPQSLVVT